MAIANNVQNVKFLRNGSLFVPSVDPVKTAREVALAAMEEQKNNLADGVAILGRYQETNGVVKTLVGFAYISGDTKTLTVFDVEGASADVEALRQEINAKLGEGVTSANTATAQLTALSGTSSDASGVTSVWGAKAYADALISELDYSDEAVAGEYVSQVTQADGKIAVTRVELPTVDDAASAKTFVTSVSEDKGQISVSKGTITSSGKTIVLTDNADGGVNFEANVDGTTIIIDENTGTMSVASSALVQYEGDNDTIQIGAVSDGKRIVSSPLTIQKVTTGLSEIVKEEYHLIGASGNTIGAPVQIYKDSHIVSITYITEGEHAQNLEYVYIDASGNTQTTYVDMSELVIEAEFASGVTVTDGVAHGVVDPTSETFLTVGEDGFKLSGVQDAINSAVSGLDATVSAETTNGHVSVQIDEVDGKLTAVTLTEDNIANADDLAELSAKTVTALTSTNGSITASIDDAAGCKTYDIETDASKIKMSGFTSTDVLSGITSSSSITEAFSEVDKVITDNEEVTAAALNDLDTRIKELSGGSSADITAEIEARQRVDGITGSAYTATSSANYISDATSLNDADQKLDAAIDNIADKYVSGITVNGSGLTVTNNIAAVTVTPATGATTAIGNEAITVQTDANGNITLGLANIDCGTY